MPLVLADRVRDTTTTTGTGTITLSGTAPTGYQNFSVIGNGNTTYYTINAGSQWEVGIGTYSDVGPTLARTTVLESSNGGALVNFSAGVKDVFVTYPADEVVIQDGATIAAGTAVLGVANGGTGLSSTPANGAIDIGNGTGFTRTTLTAGTNISITNGAGSITINATDQFVGTVTSVAASGGTTGMTFSGSPITTSGTLTLGGTLNVANGGTGVTTSTGTGSVVLNTSPTLVTPTLGAASATSIANGLGAVGTPSYTFTGDLNTGMWSPAADTLAFSEGGVEAMRLDASGRLLIGTTTGVGNDFVSIRFNSASSFPQGLNMVDSNASASGTNFQVFRRSDDTYLGNIRRNSTDNAIYVGGNSYLALGSGDTERMRIDSSGNVGIGTSSPGARLEVQGGTSTVRITNTDASAFAGVEFRDNAATRGQIWVGGSSYASFGGAGSINYSANSGPHVWYTNYSERMRLDASGNLLLGTSATTNTGQVISTAGANFSSTATKNSNMTGLTVSATTNASTMTGVWFATGNAAHWSGIAGARTNHTVDWSTHLAFYTHPADFTNIDSAFERMRIDGAGNVGIGTTSPSLASGMGIVVYNSAVGGASRIALKNGSTGDAAGDGFQLVASGGDAFIEQRENAFLAFTTNNTERVRIDASGNVGIGTSAPERRLHVVSNQPLRMGTLADWFQFTQINNNVWGWLSSSSVYPLVMNGATGNVGIGTVDPGVRLDVAGGSIRVGNTHAMTFRNSAGTGTATFTLQSDNNFVVYNAAGTPISSFTQGSTNIAVYGSNGSNRMQVDSINNVTSWIVNGSERARINSSGEFLVGTSSGGRTVCITAADNWIRQSNPSRSWLIGPSTGTSYMLWDETGGGARFTVDTSGNWFGNNAIILGSGFNNDNRIEVGQGRTGNNFAYIDLIGDTVYTDYGLRLLRGNGGQNATSELNHRGTGPFSINVQDAGVLVFSTSNTERMRFEATGNAAFSSLIVGRPTIGSNVNTNNDTGSFSVRSDASNAASISFHRVAAFAINMGLGTDNVFRIGGWSASSNCFQMDSAGNLTMLGNVTAYSDARMKKDVETIGGALDLVSKMRGVRYTRIDTEKRGVGVIAQEMLEVMPEVVQQGMGDDGTLSVAYGNLVGVLIEAVKELTARVAELEGK